MKKKRQHVIPRCYQSAWCDPRTPPGRTPSIWLVSKDGSTKKRKSPENAFVGSDAFTIQLPHGKRELIVEDTLAQIESDFVRLLRRKIHPLEPLTSQDRAVLCVFAAAMTARVDTQARNWEEFLSQMHDHLKWIEEANNLPTHKSSQMAAMVQNARPIHVAQSVDILSRLYGEMSLAIFVARGKNRFITSDNPVMWYNPEAHKVPPFYRSPGLAQSAIEVTMPLSSKFALYLSHNPNIANYQFLQSHAVQELNRRTRFSCDKWFIPWKGEVQCSWFDPGIRPDDAWENTPEGRAALERKRNKEAS